MHGTHGHEKVQRRNDGDRAGNTERRKYGDHGSSPDTPRASLPEVNKPKRSRRTASEAILNVAPRRLPFFRLFIRSKHGRCKQQQRYTKVYTYREPYLDGKMSLGRGIARTSCGGGGSIGSPTKSNISSSRRVTTTPRSSSFYRMAFITRLFVRITRQQQQQQYHQQLKQGIRGETTRTTLIVATDRTYYRVPLISFTRTGLSTSSLLAPLGVTPRHNQQRTQAELHPRSRCLRHETLPTRQRARPRDYN